jgi:hypothetical protein
LLIFVFPEQECSSFKRKFFNRFERFAQFIGFGKNKILAGMETVTVEIICEN